MITEPSLQTAVESYRKDGFFIVKDVLNTTQIQLLKQEVLAFQNNQYDVPWITGTTTYPESVNAVHFPHRVSKIIYDLALDSSITSWAALFAGAHLVDWDKRICLVQSMLYMKESDKRGQPWHQDERFTPTRDRTLVTVWVAIDPAIKENGCIWVIPGSHRKGILFPTTLAESSEEWVRSENVQIDTSQAIPLELTPGDVAFFSGYMVHGSFRNKSNTSRKSLVLNYQSFWSPLLTEAVCTHGTSLDITNVSKAIVVDLEKPKPFTHYNSGVLAR